MVRKGNTPPLCRWWHSKPVVCAGKSGCFSFANTVLVSAGLFSTVSFPLQMVDVADGRGRVGLSRTAAAWHPSCYDPECLSFLRRCLFVWFGFFKHFVHWKNKEEGRTGHMANKDELKREKKESGNLTFNININPRGAMYVMQNLRWHFTFILLFVFWAVYLYFKHRPKPSLKQLPRTRNPQNPGNILILRWRESTYF